MHPILTDYSFLEFFNERNPKRSDSSSSARQKNRKFSKETASAARQEPYNQACASYYTVTFYAARTILHSMAYDPDETDLPRRYEYLEELIMRVAALQPEEVTSRAEAFYGDCFEVYQPLERQTPEKISD
jgi:hypothetical protein